MEYSTYQQLISSDIRRTLEDKKYQPVLFLGSGLSRRYAGLPDWHGLLSAVAKECPLIKRDYIYYRQSLAHPIEIASVFSNFFHDWAWGDGRKDFPVELFVDDAPKDIFIKYAICRYIEKKIAEFSIEALPAGQREEIEAIRAVQPHAVITTNYDTLTETLFPGYESVIGQQVFRSSEVTIGEIFKIHGSTTEIKSLILNKDDYDNFIKKKKYLSAKLLTLFTEHPLIFVGYSADDPNIKSILSDIDEILAPAGTLIPNIYFLQWDSNAESNESNQIERLIPIDDHKSVRIKNIAADNFCWVFNIFASGTPLAPIDPKILRALLARTYDLVRTDIPRRRVEVDFGILESFAGDPTKLPKLFGLGNIGETPDINFSHPFFITAIAEELGFGRNFNEIRKMMKRIKTEAQFDMEQTDNRYRVTVKTGRGAKSRTAKYSEEAVELFRCIRDGKPYQIKS